MDPTPTPFVCKLDPRSKTILKVYLFKNVQNSDEIRNNIVKGVWKCAAIKPSLILDMLQVSAAANNAVLAEIDGSMVTRSVYTEILYNLSLSKNITQSLTKFGIERDSNLLICFLTTSEKDDSEQIIKQVSGEMCPIEDLHQFTNVEDLKTVYKLNELESPEDYLDVIVSSMAIKSIM